MLNAAPLDVLAPAVAPGPSESFGGKMLSKLITTASASLDGDRADAKECMQRTAPKCATRSEGLGVRGSGSCDSNQILASLLATATLALDTDRHAAKNCIQRAAALLGIDLSPGKVGPAERSYLQGGLAPWQATRIRFYIDDKLNSVIRATDLARVVQLSTSYFFRAFRKTFGEPPTVYIRQRRIRRAQELMLTSRVSLSQVALECGLCDQAHFCRTFRRFVGTSPGAWRRQFPLGAAPDGSVGRQIPARTAR
jgi:AraC family transcriptional regulator